MGRNSSERGGIRNSAATGRSHTGSLRFHFMALTPTSTASSSNFWLKNKTDFSAKQPLSWDINTAGIQMDHTHIQTAAGQLWLNSFLPLQEGDTAGGRQDTPWGKEERQMHQEVLPLKLGRLWFPKFLNASLPWDPASAMGLSIQEIKASGSPDFVQNWRRAPHPLPWLSTWVFPTSANPLFLSEQPNTLLPSRLWGSSSRAGWGDAARRERKT